MMECPELGQGTVLSTLTPVRQKRWGAASAAGGRGGRERRSSAEVMSSTTPAGGVREKPHDRAQQLGFPHVHACTRGHAGSSFSERQLPWTATELGSYDACVPPRRAWEARVTAPESGPQNRHCFHTAPGRHLPFSRAVLTANGCTTRTLHQAAHSRDPLPSSRAGRSRLPNDNRPMLLTRYALFYKTSR